MHPTPAQRNNSRCTLSLLRLVESRSPLAHPFGPKTDALWRSLDLDLDLDDRIEQLLRAADRQKETSS